MWHLLTGPSIEGAAVGICFLHTGFWGMSVSAAVTHSQLMLESLFGFQHELKTKGDLGTLQEASRL